MGGWGRYGAFVLALWGCDDGGASAVSDLGPGVAAADAGPEVYDWDLPPGFPPPRVPDDNPMSAAKVELGRHLFYDKRLSGNQSQSCASCHDQARAFTDGRARALGSTGESHFRGAMSLANVGYAATLTWANPLLETLEEQALVPMFGEHPVELGLAGLEATLFERLRAEPRYQSLFPEAFPEADEPFALISVTRALAAFQRTLISGRSPYDRATRGGEPAALSESARRGEALFFSEDLECFHCHGGFAFSDSVVHARTTFIEANFHHTALYNLDGAGAYPASDRGLYEITGEARDMGRFRAPTLRNITLTAPYMHDGSAATLDDVIDHYAAGGRRIESGEDAGDGSTSPLRSEFVTGFALTAEQRADLLAFLESLTDDEFMTNPRYGDPW